MRKKIALVNQRYGLEVNGGSELHCRQLAEKLIEVYDVEVLTTCALEYTTWENYYREGVETINGITVRRFKVDKQRDVKKFNQLSEKVLISEHSDEEEEKWIDGQGPFCPDFLAYIKEHSGEYYVIIFMTYLYYLSARGLPLELKNAFLLPTAHDEPPIYLRHYTEVFQNAKGFIYNTVEEKELIERLFDVSDVPSVIAGVGVDIPERSELIDAKKKYSLENYILYIGRIDESKGCKILFDYFIKYKERNKSDLKLVLAGKSVMKIPKHEAIIHLGFVSDPEKFSLINQCRLLVLASEFESLSMVVLESMAYEKPVLVNGKCSVLKGHCHRSNAGLYFENYYEFEGALNYMLSKKKDYEAMCENAKRYVDENYKWNIIIDRICNLIDSFTKRRD